jgi:hypothetical protein
MTNNPSETNESTTPLLRVDEQTKDQPSRRTNVPAQKDETVEYWVSTISKALGFSAGWLIKTGDHLIQAKAKLGHGRWTELFGRGRLSFSLRTAEVLMSIARHPSMRNSQNLASLPTSCAALSELVRVDAQVLQRGIEEGSVNPEMTARQAKSFVSAQSGADLVTPPEPVAFDSDKHLGKITRWIMKATEDWPQEDRHVLAGALKQLAEEVVAADFSPSS